MAINKLIVLAILCAYCSGCGSSGETILPTDNLTDAQIEAVKAEDKAVADEEGGRK